MQFVGINNYNFKKIKRAVKFFKKNLENYTTQYEKIGIELQGEEVTIFGDTVDFVNSNEKYSIEEFYDIKKNEPEIYSEWLERYKRFWMLDFLNSHQGIIKRAPKLEYTSLITFYIQKIPDLYVDLAIIKLRKKQFFKKIFLEVLDQNNHPLTRKCAWNDPPSHYFLMEFIDYRFYSLFVIGLFDQDILKIKDMSSIINSPEVSELGISVYELNVCSLGAYVNNKFDKNTSPTYSYGNLWFDNQNGVPLEELPESPLIALIKKNQDDAAKVEDTKTATTNEAILKAVNPSDIMGLQLSNEDPKIRASVKVTAPDIRMCLDIEDIEYQGKFFNTLENTMILEKFLKLFRLAG